MFRWWEKFLRMVSLRITYPKRPSLVYNVDHWHIITILGYELAILRLERTSGRKS
jgi:hypothetical protein